MYKLGIIGYPLGHSISAAIHNAGLVNVTIPANVTTIKGYAFRKSGVILMNFEINYGWSAGGGKISATELYNNAADILTLIYYTDIWTRDVNAPEESIDPNYVTGGACNTDTMWALTYIDDERVKMKLTISGFGVMP